MECTLKAFLKRLKSPWLSSVEPELFLQKLKTHYQSALDLEPGSIILLAEKNPEEFWSAFLGSAAAKRPIALFAQEATEKELDEAIQLLKPGLIYGVRYEKRLHSLPRIDYSAKVLIPTGGSGGRLRFATHDRESLSAAVEGLAHILGPSLSAIAPLPLYHVSGFMPGLRAFLKEGEVDYPSSKDFEEGAFWEKIPHRLISCVPTQLERFLNNKEAVDVLRKARVIFLGGAKASASLLKKADEAQLPIAMSYGMTETAAMITLQLRKKGLQRKLGEALPHVKLWIQEASDAPLLKKGTGRLWIESKSLFQGYFPETPQKQNLYLSNDFGILEEGGLKEVWRADRLIISGGEKIDPSLVEEALIETKLIQECHVLGKKDTEWGEKVVAYCVFKNQESEDFIKLKEHLSLCLNSKQMPKEWHCLPALPRKENGKIHIQALFELSK